MKGFGITTESETVLPSAAPGFKYRGGKSSMREILCSWFPRSGSTFAEPFAGRANIFFLMKTISSFDRWVLNDIRMIPWFEAILRYDGHSLPYLTKEDLRNENFDEEDRLLMEPILYWGGGRWEDSSPTGHDKGRTEPKPYETRLKRAKTLLKSAEFSERDAIEVIDEFGPDKDAFLYIDPPYLDASVNSYSDEDIDFEGMLKAMSRCRCRWAFSHYHHPLVEDYFGDPGYEFKVRIFPNPNSEVLWQDRTECLWFNYEAKSRPLFRPGG